MDLEPRKIEEISDSENRRLSGRLPGFGPHAPRTAHSQRGCFLAPPAAYPLYDRAPRPLQCNMQRCQRSSSVTAAGLRIICSACDARERERERERDRERQREREYLSAATAPPTARELAPSPPAAAPSAAAPSAAAPSAPAAKEVRTPAP